MVAVGMVSALTRCVQTRLDLKLLERDPLMLLCLSCLLAGKTLSARAVANRTDACFIRVIGSELVQKYVGEGARMVREIFTMARSKKVQQHTVI